MIALARLGRASDVDGKKLPAERRDLRKGRRGVLPLDTVVDYYYLHKYHFRRDYCRLLPGGSADVMPRSWRPFRACRRSVVSIHLLFEAFPRTMRHDKGCDSSAFRIALLVFGGDESTSVLGVTSPSGPLVFVLPSVPKAPTSPSTNFLRTADAKRACNSDDE